MAEKVKLWISIQTLRVKVLWPAFKLFKELIWFVLQVISPRQCFIVSEIESHYLSEKILFLKKNITLSPCETTKSYSKFLVKMTASHQRSLSITLDPSLYISSPVGVLVWCQLRMTDLQGFLFH